MKQTLVNGNCFFLFAGIQIFASNLKEVTFTCKLLPKYELWMVISWKHISHPWTHPQTNLRCKLIQRLTQKHTHILSHTLPETHTHTHSHTLTRTLTISEWEWTNKRLTDLHRVNRQFTYKFNISSDSFENF